MSFCFVALEKPLSDSEQLLETPLNPELFKDQLFQPIAVYASDNNTYDRLRWFAASLLPALLDSYSGSSDGKDPDSPYQVVFETAPYRQSVFRLFNTNSSQEKNPQTKPYTTSKPSTTGTNSTVKATNGKNPATPGADTKADITLKSEAIKVVNASTTRTPTKIKVTETTTKSA